jgi:hypothetical protein
MVDQDICRQCEGIYLADRVAFQELEGALLGSLPGRDELEGVDVPPNECRQSKVARLAAASTLGSWSWTSRFWAQAFAAVFVEKVFDSL